MAAVRKLKWKHASYKIRKQWKLDCCKQNKNALKSTTAVSMNNTMKACFQTNEDVIINAQQTC